MHLPATLLVLLALVLSGSGATVQQSGPLAGPCAPGTAYDPACDVNRDGVINLSDVQLTAGHWNQSGTWTSDNDHDHLGQTWTGSDNPLTIDGSFAFPESAPLVLSNNAVAQYGLRVESPRGTGIYVDAGYFHGLHVNAADLSGVYVNAAGVNGLYVGGAGADGLRVDSAGANGVSVDSADISGVRVASAGGDGLYVLSAGLDGVNVRSTGRDGLHVWRAGSTFTSFASDLNNGVEIEGAEGYGLYVGRASEGGLFVGVVGNNGVTVGSADDHGVLVNLAGADGVYVGLAYANGLTVDHAVADGLNVGRAGTPGTTTASPYSNGVEVGGAERHGVYVGHADFSGLYVERANVNGVRVVSAGQDGLKVDSAADDGVQVDSAGQAGVYVGSAGANGLRVVSAGNYGLRIDSAGLDGVYVESATDDGVYVNSAGDDGVYANTTQTSGEWGFITTDKIYGSNVTLEAISLVAQVSGPDSLNPGDLVAAAGVADPLPGSAVHTSRVRLAGAAFNGVVGVVEHRLVLTSRPGEPDAAGSPAAPRPRRADGPAQPGDYVALTVLGAAQVRVEADAGIQAGQRLTAAGTPGRARALRSKEIDGMLVSEGAPVLGVALEDQAPGQELIWVLVSPR